jgi:hypothetical protein
VSTRGIALALLVFVLGAGLARAEVVQRGHLRISFEGKLTPHTLPRSRSAPVAVAVGGTIATTDGTSPPQLQRISISINANGRLDRSGLPVCRIGQIQPATTEGALEACRGSLVGDGSFSASVLLPEQAPFPSRGKVYAFNGVFAGRPAILAHVYGTDPAPTSYTLPFQIAHTKGTFGTVLSASLPQVTSEWGYVTGFDLSLGRGHSSRAAGAFVSASCPAPKGFPGAVFPLARASFSFAGLEASTTLSRSCDARG